MPKPPPEDRTRSFWEQNPYPGLRAFEPEEDYLYFGRQRQIDELVRRLRHGRFLSVVGTSGSGKSSLVRAGLVPSLHSGLMTRAGSSWRVAILRPGNDPIESLAAALDDPAILAGDEDLGEAGRMILETILRSSSLGLVDCVRQAEIPPADNVLLVIDQFEELFRYKRSRGASRDQAVAFVKLLLETADADVPLYVVLTMRSDFLGDCMEFPGLPERINESLYLVPRMTRDELRMAITGPMKVRGGEISPRLVSRLLNDVGDDQDQLPVLQHALMRMWAHWEYHRTAQEPIDVEHYEAIGTMRKALSLHAEKAYQQLRTERHQEIAERLFKTLTDTDRDGRGVRRPAPAREVCEITGADPELVIEVIDGFRIPGRSFLMPPLHVRLHVDSYVDLSHESLMRNWDRLVRWSAEEAEAAEIYRRLCEAAELHRAGQAGLWRPPELDVGLDWKEKNHPTETWARRYSPAFDQTMAFLEESRQKREQYLTRREEERRRELQRRREEAKRARLLALSMALTVVLGVLVFFVYAHQARQEEQAARLYAALSARDPLVKALLLAELEDASGQEWAVQVAQRVATEPIPTALLRGPGEALIATAFTPDGEHVLAVTAAGACYRWPSDGRGDRVPCEPEEPAAASEDPVPADGPERAVTAAFSRDGERVAVGFTDGAIRIRPTSDSSHDTPRTIDWQVKVMAVAFSPDGERVVAGYDDYSARIWDRDGGARVLGGDDGGASMAARTIDEHGDVTVGEVSSWHTGSVVAAVFDPSGERVATGSWDGTVRLWNLKDPGELVVLDGGRGELQSVAFSGDDGRWLICGYSDGSALIWRSDGFGKPVALEGHGGPVIDVAFSPDLARVVTTSGDRVARVWNLRSEPPEATARLEVEGPAQALGGHAGSVSAAAFSADGAWIVTVSEDGTARVWPSEAREPRILGRHEKRVRSVDFSRYGRRVLTASDDATAKIWPLDDTGRPPVGFGHPDWVRSAAFGPDDALVVTGSADGTVRLWNPDTGKQRLFPESNPVVSVAFSDGRIAAAAQWSLSSEGGRPPEVHDVRVWTLDDQGRQIGEPRDLSRHSLWVWSVAFSRDGSRLVTASEDGTVRLWPVAGGTGTSLVANHRGPVFKAVLSPDESGLVSASKDGMARLWRIDEGRGVVLHHELRHEGAVRDAAFSPAGDRVVTASSDGTARIWSVETGREQLVLRHGSEVWAAAFRPPDQANRSRSGDERLEIVTGAKDGVVRLWRVSLSALLDYTKNVSTGCLTADQRVRFLAESPSRAQTEHEDCERRFHRSPERDEPAD